jgi:hypothetical protein
MTSEPDEEGVHRWVTAVVLPEVLFEEQGEYDGFSGKRGQA